MSESIALSLPRTKCENVRVLFSRIRLLFGVTVELLSATDSGGFAFTAIENPTGVGGRTEMSRLILTALAAVDGTGPDRTERLNYAKDYLLAACSEGGSRCERRCQYAPDVFQKLVPLRDEVERESRAMVRFEPQESLVIACGHERNVMAAIRYLDHKAQDIVATRSAISKPQLQQQQESPAAVCREVFRQCRPHLESEDSSYDSDFDNADPTTPTQPDGSLIGPGVHDDVSRTVSDTLAAEFAEYVTTAEGKPLRDLSLILTDPNYTSRVEFALKLGYTESQVQIALQKLGVQPSQNELLAELIKLGATSSSLGGPGSDVSPADLSLSGDVQLCHKDKQKDESSESECGADSLARSELFPCSSDVSNLRHIVIDGSNVAMSHGNKECFSCRGIKLCVDWFKARGHQNITVFVPRWRKEVSRPDAPIRDQEILTLLEKERLLVFTPSRHVGGRRMTCYDDRYVLRLAVDTDGVVVSNDSYKDLAAENADYKKVIEDRLLMYSFVNDRFMPPEDPLGRHGPSLDNFLRKTPIRSSEPLPPPCPYGKKCTYGNKCKYYHPERGNQPQKSVTERLAEQAKIPLQEVKSRGLKSRESSPGDKLVCQTSGNSRVKKQPLSRTKSLVPPPCVSETATQERSNIVERTKSDSSTAKCQESIFVDQLTRQQQMHQQALFQSMVPSAGFPSGSAAAWPSSIPQVSLTVSSPLSMQPTATTLASSWAALSPALPPNIPGSCAEMFLEPDSGGHLFVAKRLSDPDSLGTKSSTVKSYPAPQIHQQQSLSHENTTGNMHRKLQRQLSLNPACDPRLVQLSGYAGHHQLLSPPQEQPFGLLHQQQTEQSDHRIGAQDQLHRAFTRTPTIHQPLGRMASEGRVPNPLQAVAHVWDSVEHQTVTRISSAPDPNLHWPPLSRMQHLNSTSDTRLNMYPDLQRTAMQSALTGYEGGPHQWISQGHTLEPPRPMSPGGISAMGPSKTSWQDHISSQVIGQPVRPSSVPPQAMHLGGLSLPARPHTPEQPIDTRYKLEYHLSSIFPKDQVRAAMDMYPQETNPQKICAAILSMFPPNG